MAGSPSVQVLRSCPARLSFPLGNSYAMRCIITTLGFAIIALTGCATHYDRPPETKMIELGFFSCGECGSLSGGIFGKGPTRHYRSEEAARCVHDWQRVAKEEFQRLATDGFDVDWSGETYFWFVESEKP